MTRLNRLAAVVACVGAVSCGATSDVQGLIGAWEGPSSRGATTGCPTRFEGAWTLWFFPDGSFAQDASSVCTDPRSGCRASATGLGTWTSSAPDSGNAVVTILMEGPATFSGCADASNDGVARDTVRVRYQFTVVGSSL